MKKAAIIGFGKMGKIRYNVIKKLKIFNIVAIYDQKKQGKNKLFVRSLNTILNNQDIEIIF